MWQILQQPEPDDYVLATGETHSVREFVEKAFQQIGVRIVWKGARIEEKGLDAGSGRILVEVDPGYFRPTEVDILVGDPSKARSRLGWRHGVSFEQLVAEMIAAETSKPLQARHHVSSLPQINARWSQLDMTGKRVFVVGPVFLESSSQTAMTLDLDDQAVAPARPRCRHFRTRKLALLAPEAASSSRRRFDSDVPGNAGSDSGHHCVLVQSFKSIFAFTPLSSLSGVVADKLRI